MTKKNQIINQNNVHREKFLDVAKGIALFFVVLGHLVTFEGTAFTWIFSFHMMLFFFISGYQFNSDKYSSFRFLEYFEKKVKSLLVPFVIVSFIGAIFCLIIPSWRGGIDNLYFFLLYLAQPEPLKVGQIWFLVCLFWTEIIFFYLYKTIFSHVNMATIVFIMILISVIGFNMNAVTFLNNPRIPWKIDASITALVFYGMGFYAKKIGLINKLLSYKYSKVISAILMIFCGALGFYVAKYMNGYVNICNCTYGNYFYFYIAAICGIVFILLLSKFCENIKILKYYGENTLWMFSLHSFLLYLSVYILNLATKMQYEIMKGIPFAYCLIMAIFIYIALGFIPFAVKLSKKLGGKYLPKY